MGGVLRLGVGVTAIFLLAMVFQWTLAYLAPIFLPPLLQAGRPLRAAEAVRLLVAVLIVMLGTYVLAGISRQIPLLFVLLLIPMLFATFRSLFRGGPVMVVLMILIGLVLMVVLSALATILPATLGPEANPLQTPEVIKPEWFFYVAFRWLKLFTGTAAVLSMGFIVFVMFAWPWIDNWIRKHTRFQEASVWIGILGVLTIIGLTLWEAFARH